jgi:hypothetical protein
MLRQLDASDVLAKDYDRFFVELRKAVEEAFEKKDLPGVHALLWICDDKTNYYSMSVRYKYAIRSMPDKRYDFAFVAWDDGGVCWPDDDTDDAGDTPSVAVATRCWWDACKEILTLKRELHSRDLVERLKTL